MKLNNQIQQKMESNAFSEVVNILLEIKLTLQRGYNNSLNELLGKIDFCISKIAPFIDIYQKGSFISASDNLQESKMKSSILSRTIRAYSANFQISPIKHRISNQQQITKVKNSFIRQSIEEQMIHSRPEHQNILMDYFVVRYNLDLQQFTISGKNKGGQTDRKVFVDLLSFQQRPSHIQKLAKSSSMTSILKEIFSQFKITEPFVLPNCQQEQNKFLFVYGLRQCGVKEKEYYRTQTFCCFVTKYFIIEELNKLMDEISKGCFESRVNEASSSQDQQLLSSISSLYRKKTYQCIERIVQKFIERTDTKRYNQNGAKLFNLKSIDLYLQKNDVMWSILKRTKSKDQKLFYSLLLLYYFVIHEYKIIVLARTQNKHIISELAIGLIRALEPLTYTYPIVGATITTHHFQFANSPVPIFIGLWGSSQDLKLAKNTLKAALKAQKNMTASQLQNQINFVVFDLEEHSLQFSETQYKQFITTCESLQKIIDQRTKDNLASKLSYFTTQLVKDSVKKTEWSQKLKQRLKASHMYDYFKGKK